MAADINVSKDYTATGAQGWIALNTFAPSNTTVKVDIPSGQTATYTVEMTTAELNRGETEDPCQVTGLIDLTTDIARVIENTPMTFIRLNISALSGGTMNFRVMQAGRW